MASLFQTCRIKRVAAVVATLFLASCLSLTDTPSELETRISDGLALCAAPEVVSTFEKIRISRLQGPHKCEEQRETPRQRRRVLASNDKSLFFEQDKGCSFTLRNVDESIINRALTSIALENNWLERGNIIVGACKRSTCNGRDRCYYAGDSTRRIFADLDTKRTIQFRWNRLDGKRNILTVSSGDMNHNACPEEQHGTISGCFKPGAYLEY